MICENNQVYKNTSEFHTINNIKSNIYFYILQSAHFFNIDMYQHQMDILSQIG